MENKIYRVTASELPLLKKQLVSMGDVWIGEIDGNSIRDLKDYFRVIYELMRFPRFSKFPNYPGYEDWICDLSWLNADGYVLIITNYSGFMSEDLEEKEYVIKAFEEVILPWWQKDVEKYVVEGKAKPFNLVLVD
jgi:hypothetical protein